jgi:hypothetical protein
MYLALLIAAGALLAGLFGAAMGLLLSLWIPDAVTPRRPLLFAVVMAVGGAAGWIGLTSLLDGELPGARDAAIGATVFGVMLGTFVYVPAWWSRRRAGGRPVTRPRFTRPR